MLITLLTISGRGCSKRAKRGGTEGAGSGGGGEWIRLNAPSNLNAIAISPNQIELSWQDNSSKEDGFEIERKIGLSGTYAPLITTTVNYYSDTNNVANGLTYFYRVRAFNTIGDNSDWVETSVSITVIGSIYAIAAGYKHTLALASNGMVWSWGSNYYGELGFTDYNDKTQPTLISSDFNYDPFDNVTRITAGGDDLTQGSFSGHSISRKTDGTLWVWGANYYGQLGTGDNQDLNGPLQFYTNTDWSLITAGGGHTAALKNNRTLWIWGRNDYGQLGLGNTSNRNTATAVGTDSDWSNLSGGRYYTLGLKTDRSLWAWGNNYYGQLGLDDTINRWTPAQVGTDSDWIEIAAGYYHTLGRKTAGTLWAWGYNYYGLLGDGTSSNRKTPRQIGTDTDWSMVSGGLYHTIGISNGGTLWIWGGNDYGQLGLGDTIKRSSPVQVGIQTDWSIIKAGALYSLGLKTNGTLWAWGQNDSGQLGVADPINRDIPTQVIFDAPFPPNSLLANIVSSTQINLSWTDNSNNEEGFKIARKLGYSGTYEEIATVGINITSWSDISQTGFALDTYYYYRVRAFNNFGNSAYPEVYVAFSGSWANVSCGETHTIGIRTTGTISGWGDGTSGQLGLGGNSNKNKPTQIWTDTDWSLIKAGGIHTIALKNNASFWAWGDNAQGQLGNGTTIDRLTPLNIGTDTDWAEIAGGSRWTIGIKTTGILWSWGVNWAGQLGLGDNDQRNRPNQLGGTPSPHPALTATLISLSQIDLNWSDTDNETGFKIERKIGMSGTYTQLVTVNANITSYSDTPVTPSNTYYYRVEAFNTVGENLSLPVSLVITSTYVYKFSSVNSFPTPILYSDWVDIAAGYAHALGRRKVMGLPGNQAGTLWAWGYNNFGQLGLGDNGEETNRNTPTQIGADTDWVEIATGSYHTMGRKATGTLWGWGYNIYGQLGLGNSGYWDYTDPEYPVYVTENDRNTPTQIGTDSDWAQIATHLSNHTIGRKTNGTLWAWGRNNSGQLGLGDNGEETNRNTPTQIGTNTDWAKIAVGGTPAYGAHSVSLKTNGTLWTWGSNLYGQLGLGDAFDRNVPTLVGQ